MFGLSATAVGPHRDYTACTGCGLCFLVCPMWRSHRDPRFTPQGLAKALQCGAKASALAAPLDACSLCGACDPVCPESIDLSRMIMDLRLALPRRPDIDARHEELARLAAGAAPPPAGALLLPGPDLRAEPALLARVQALLGHPGAEDDGADIALALEAGIEIPRARRRRFLDRLDGRALVVADGLLLRQLRCWLPAARLRSLGEALGNLVALRRRLTGADFYVIESRAFHADYERMVAYYDRLQLETGCGLSLDLQRIAIPTRSQGLAQKLGLTAGDDTAQARWVLQGRKPTRIVVESLADRAVLERACELPVVHLAELGEDPEMMKKFRHAFG